MVFLQTKSYLDNKQLAKGIDFDLLIRFIEMSDVFVVTTLKEKDLLLNLCVM